MRERLSLVSIGVMVVVWIFARDARADELVLKDGTVLKGTLVGFEHAVYQLQMGKFVKDVPESQVATIRGQGVRAAPGGPPPAASSATAPGAVAPVTSVSGAGGESAAGAAGASRPVAPPAAGQAPAAAAKAGDVLGRTLHDAGIDHPEDLVGADGGAPSDQDVLGKLLSGGLGGGEGGGAIDPAKIQNNPELQKMAERFKDPAYRDALLREVESMQGQLDPNHPSPLVDKLKDLFGQLDAAGGSSPPSPPAPAAPPPGGAGGSGAAPGQ